ncbi:MAG: SGNH/GDSL hydrolase family protein [Clostridium celatum]|nr:SGNH/GDSL hydrolase family protein [Clostridium celatum]
MEFKVTTDMINNSLVSKGDVSRIERAMNKAKGGKDITIAFLGGSITQGCNATKFEECYASRTYKWFKDKFRNVKVKYVNAGVGATGSIIGAHRVEKQVLSQNPDIVFIDFAVNDKDSIYDKVAYESIIRKILSVENAPAIVEIFMSNFDGSNVQHQQIEIGKKYNIPMISFRNSIYTEMVSDRLHWKDVASDEVHPNDYGHFIISNLLTAFMEEVYKNLKEVKVNRVELGEPLFGDKYISGITMNNNNIEAKEVRGFSLDNEGFQVFKDGWRFISETCGEGSLSVDLEGRNIFLLYKKTIKDTAAKLSVRIDDKEEMIIDTFFENGWGDYSATELLIEELLSEKHKVEIKVLNENKTVEAYIMGFLVS